MKKAWAFPVLSLVAMFSFAAYCGLSAQNSTVKPITVLAEKSNTPAPLFLDEHMTPVDKIGAENHEQDYTAK